MVTGARFKIEGKFIQRIVPLSVLERFEGIAFSGSGNTMAIATSETNQVLLVRRQADGRFEDSPFQRIGQSPKSLDYPHDISLSRGGNTELLAVAQRAGAIAIYRGNGFDQSFEEQPAFEISGLTIEASLL